MLFFPISHTYIFESHTPPLPELHMKAAMSSQLASPSTPIQAASASPRPNVVNDTAAASSAVAAAAAVNAYLAQPSPTSSHIQNSMIIRAHTSKVARLHRCVRIFGIIVRKWLAKKHSSSPHINERNHIVPRLAALSAISRSAMEVDVNFPPDCHLPLSASASDHAENCSKHVWNIPTLRPVQRDVLAKLLDGRRIRKHLIVQPTALGKTHIMRVFGTIMKGIHVIIHPLLALTADQHTAFVSGNEAFGKIEVHNLDEQAAKSLYVRKKIMQRLLDLKRSSSTTIFLLCSPQFLAFHDDFTAALRKCNENKTLRSNSVDECHLFAQHGTYFRAEIRKTSDVYFNHLYKNKNIHPHLLALTATMTNSDLKVFENLVHTTFPPASRTWASSTDFRQDHIAIQLVITSAYSTQLHHTVEYCRVTDGSAFIFANSKALTYKLVASIEKKLDVLDKQVDVLHIHGGLDKSKKFHLINIFCRNVTVDIISPQVAISTAAADLGVNCRHCTLVQICEWCENISSFVQRKGRGARNGEESVTSMNAGLSSILSLEKRIDRAQHVDDDDDDANEDSQTIHNTSVAISNQKQSPRSKKIADEYPLSRYQLQSNALRQRSQLMDVLNIFCLRKGCIQRRLEQYLADGEINDSRVDITSPCLVKCPICDGKWEKYFRPVRKDGIVAWLQNSQSFPCNANSNDLIDTIWKHDYWIKAIFDRTKKTICKYNVEALLLQMVAAKLIMTTKIGVEFKWAVACKKSNSPITQYHYHDNTFWVGMYLRDPLATVRYNLDNLTVN